MSLNYHYRHHDRFLPAALEDRLIGLLARAAGLAMLAVVAMVWMTILTWSSDDPSLTHATGGNAGNIFGYLGATVSDLFLQTFGIACSLILLAPMFWGTELLLSERVKEFGAKATYFPLSVLMLAGAFSSLPIIPGWPLHHGFGGILGDAVYRLGSSLMATGLPEHAGALTGLVFFAFGSACLAYSIGNQLKDIAALIKSHAARRALNPRAEPEFSNPSLDGPVLSGLPRPDVSFTRARAWGERMWRQGSWSDRFKAFAHGDTEPGPEPSHHDDRFTGDDGNVHQHYHRYSNAPHHPAPTTPGAPQYRAQHNPHMSQRPGQHAQNPAHQPAGYAHGAPNQPQPSAPTRATGPATIPAPGPTRHQTTHANPPAPHTGPRQPLIRGNEFDGTTDAASHSIARRFAPPSAVTHAPQHPQQPRPARTETPAAPPQPATTPEQPARAGQSLLRGLKFSSGPPRYLRPSLNLLKSAGAKKPAAHLTKTVLRGNASLLEEVLADFGIKGEIRAIKPGPVVTLFELEPARGTKSSRVIGLADDIARSMSASSARVSVIQGRNAIGIELPNARKDPVLLREILESETFRTFPGTLPISLGKSITGDAVIGDLARMPHLLIAGTTGSGKSVGVNAIIASLLYRFSPDECRLVMIDPKMLELSVYNDIPHLLTPVVTDPQMAVNALNWVITEMEERYKRMSKMGVRNIDIYNNRVKNAKKRGDMIARTVQTGFDKHTGRAVFENQQMEMETMPYIVVVIDEFADLMIAAGKEIEAAIQRLAQMARAAGIHLIMATQRPSVDVVTGTIKANFPTRVSFKVATKVDSRTILGEQGAEQLLGDGDMLYASGAGNTLRVHGPFIADDEVENIVSDLRQRYKPQYVDGLTDTIGEDDEAQQGSSNAKSNDAAKTHDFEELYERAVALVLRDGKATTSYLQRRLSIGYNRAADLIERMEQQNIVSPPGPKGKRTIIAGNPGDTSGD